MPTLLSIDPEKVQKVILEARAFDAGEDEVDDDDGSNAGDEAMVDVREESGEDTTHEELLEAIRGMDEDEQVDLVTLAWIGRGTFRPEEWSQARSEAAFAHNARTAEYLTSLPMLGDYLEEGLAAITAAENEDDEE
jgi:uncharacterized protein DUF3775